MSSFTILPACFPHVEFIGHLRYSRINTYLSLIGWDILSHFHLHKAFGHNSISVLNGGLPAWEKADGPVETGSPDPVEPQVYKVSHVNKDIVRDYGTVLSNARNIQQGKDGAQVLDARPYARFTGEAPEPRIGLSSGHMPGSISVAFNEVVESGEMLDGDKLRKVFESKGIDIDKEIITSCGNFNTVFQLICMCIYSLSLSIGSGITASILYLALERTGARKLSVYDGSWTEYAAKDDALIIKD